jgi:hypothetical protein
MSAARTRASTALVLAAVVLAPRESRADGEKEPWKGVDTKGTAPNEVEMTVRADHDGVSIERRLMVVEGWQATFGLPVLNSTQRWEPICVTPCTVKVDPNSHFRIAGENVAPSKNFTLPRDRKNLTLNVSGGSVLAYDAGVGLTTLGAVLLAAGFFAVFYASTVNNPNDQSSLRTVGFTLGGAGIVTGAVGMPLWFFGKSTVFTCPDGQRLATRSNATTF